MPRKGDKREQIALDFWRAICDFKQKNKISNDQEAARILHIGQGRFTEWKTGSTKPNTRYYVRKLVDSGGFTFESLKKYALDGVAKMILDTMAYEEKVINSMTDEERREFLGAEALFKKLVARGWSKDIKSVLKKLEKSNGK